MPLPDGLSEFSSVRNHNPYIIQENTFAFSHNRYNLYEYFFQGRHGGAGVTDWMVHGLGAA